MSHTASKNLVNIKVLVAGLALVMASSLANATIISGTDTHTTSDGSVVNLSGLDWLSWDETLGQTRTSIENGWGGLLSDGWRYASVSEYSLFMNSVFDYHGDWSTDNQDGAQWIYDNIYGSTETGPSGGNSVQYYNIYGLDNECADAQTTCYGYFRIHSADWSSGEVNMGWSHVTQHNGTRMRADNMSSYASSAMLVRQAASVPEPATITLLGMGLLGLGVVRRRRQA